MSVPMKKPRIETITVRGLVIPVPREKAKALLVLLKDELLSATDDDDELVSASDSPALKELHAKYSKAGATLQGARVKEGLSQVELAEKLKISQTNLSKMENGKRPIGKNMAKRLSKVLNINYRVFL